MPDAHGYEWGTGRRKTSVARVRIKKGSGQFVINGRIATNGSGDRSVNFSQFPSEL